MAVAERKDPYVSFQFAVEIDQQIVGGFSEVSGLEIETDVERFREGGVNLYERQLAGPAKFPSRVVLKRGMTDADVLWAWHQDVCKGLVRRKDVSIILRDVTGEEQRRWSFRAAAPVKWSGPQFRASGNEVAVETLELVHDGLFPR
jgi:phage tail-like protein